MKITLLLLGATDKGWISDGLKTYSDRLRHYCSFEIKEIPQLKGAAALDKEQIKAREGELILKCVRAEDCVVLMDERGEQYTSLQWASKIQSYMNSGRNLVFVIGGAYGFSPQVYGRADVKISLSRMTFSHQMVRIIFTEQLYRAFTILNNEPYHHE